MLTPSDRRGVVVAGSLHVDLIASAHRLPVRGETLPGASFAIRPGGKAGNQAAAVAAQGVPCSIIGRVGADAFGDLMRESLAARGVQSAFVEIDPGEPTGASTVLTGEGGDYASIIVPAASMRVDADQISRSEPAFRRAAWAVTQFELGIVTAEAFLRTAKQFGCRTLLNAAPAPEIASEIPAGLWEAIDILVVNRVEAAMLTGLLVGSPADARVAATTVAVDRRVPVVVVTLGEDGVVAVWDDETIEVRVRPVEVVDTVGAGDAFVGVLAASLVQGLPPGRSLERASAAGTLAVMRRGADSSPTPAEIDRFLNGLEPLR